MVTIAVARTIVAVFRRTGTRARARRCRRRSRPAPACPDGRARGPARLSARAASAPPAPTACAAAELNAPAGPQPHGRRPHRRPRAGGGVTADRVPPPRARSRGPRASRGRPRPSPSSRSGSAGRRTIPTARRRRILPAEDDGNLAGRGLAPVREPLRRPGLASIACVVSGSSSVGRSRPAAPVAAAISSTRRGAPRWARRPSRHRPPVATGRRVGPMGRAGPGHRRTEARTRRGDLRRAGIDRSLRLLGTDDPDAFAGRRRRAARTVRFSESSS